MQDRDRLYIDGAWVPLDRLRHHRRRQRHHRGGHGPDPARHRRRRRRRRWRPPRGAFEAWSTDAGRGAGEVPAAPPRGPATPAWTRSRRRSRGEVGMPMVFSPDRSRPGCRRWSWARTSTSPTSSRSRSRSATSLVVREPVGVVGVHHAVELPAAPDRGEGRAGARRRLHGRAQAERGRAAERRSSSPRSSTTSACPRACSTSSPATVPSSARRSSRTPTSTWCRSPGRPVRASGSPSSAPQTVKKVALELGGKSPFVILADAAGRGRGEGRCAAAAS